MSTDAAGDIRERKLAPHPRSSARAGIDLRETAVGIADDRKRRQDGSIPLKPCLQAEFWSDPCRITLSKQERALVQT